MMYCILYLLQQIKSPFNVLSRGMMTNSKSANYSNKSNQASITILLMAPSPCKIHTDWVSIVLKTSHLLRD